LLAYQFHSPVEGWVEAKNARNKGKKGIWKDGHVGVPVSCTVGANDQLGGAVGCVLGCLEMRECSVPVQANAPQQMHFCAGAVNGAGDEVTKKGDIHAHGATSVFWDPTRSPGPIGTVSVHVHGSVPWLKPVLRVVRKGELKRNAPVEGSISTRRCAVKKKEAALQGCLSVLTPQHTSLCTRTGMNTIITWAQMEGRQKGDEVEGEGAEVGGHGFWHCCGELLSHLQFLSCIRSWCVCLTSLIHDHRIVNVILNCS